MVNDSVLMWPTNDGKRAASAGRGKNSEVNRNQSMTMALGGA